VHKSSGGWRGASLPSWSSSSDGAAPLLTLVSSALGFKASPVEVQVASATESAGGSSSLGLAMRPLVLARCDSEAPVASAILKAVSSHRWAGLSTCLRSLDRA
jgi:hypothetical protein